MAYTCAECGKGTTYLIEDVCQDCFDQRPDYEEILRERAISKAERWVLRGEGDTRNFIFREPR